MKEIQIKKNEGITLIALVVTIIILLILAGVAIKVVLGENGLFNRSKEAVENHKIEAAREKLELTLGEAGIDKESNPAYTQQDDYLDKLIIERISGAEIIGNTVSVDGYMFEIDRSVPKIIQYIGPVGNIKYPDLSATVDVAIDNKSATINIKAKEDEDGISKIEIILNGRVIETIDGHNGKSEINETYTVMQNGSYTIKAYSRTSKSVVAEVRGIAMTLSYEPNGSREWKKSYSVKLSVDDTLDPVSSIKYKWLEDVAGVIESNFVDAQSCNNGDTVEFEVDSNGEPTPKLTGTYYLWTMMETISGQKEIKRSEAFYFDNEGPIINLSVEPTTLTSLTMKVTAIDNNSGKVSRIEYWIDDVKMDTKDYIDGENSLTIETRTGENKKCKVKVFDTLGNSSELEKVGATLSYTWNTYTVTVTSDTCYTDDCIEKIATFSTNSSRRIWQEVSFPTWYSDLLNSGYNVFGSQLGAGNFTMDSGNVLCELIEQVDNPEGTIGKSFRVKAHERD